MGRAPCCEKVGLKRGRWTAEEDQILTKYILANGEGSWRSLPKNAGLLRCGKSCRLRWINYLRAGLKRGNITREEEETIVKLHTALGNRWSLIAAHFPGRTDNEIKNYWNSHLSRKIYCFRKCRNDNSLPVATMNIANATGTYKRRGGRTSTSSMKKHKHTLMSLGEPKSRMFEPAAAKATAEFEPAAASPSKSLGPQRIVNEKETEDLGPYELVDSEIKRLEFALRGKVVDHRISANGLLGMIEEKAKGHGDGVMGPGTNEHIQERESSSNSNGWVSSNGENVGEWYNFCSSPVNSRFDEEWFHLDWMAGGRGGRDQSLWDLLDEDHKLLPCIFGNGNSEGDQGCHYIYE